MNYVLGFIFSKDYREVALIRKSKPEWQAGLLNGIGGKVESGEHENVAMARETKEEAGIETVWSGYCVMEGINNDQNQFRVHCYYAVDNLDKIESMESEKISVYHVSDILNAKEKTITNLKWLIPLAIDCSQNKHSPTFAHIIY